MCAMRISFAWPKASPAAALNAAAMKYLENFMTPPDLSMMECILFGARLRLGPPAHGDARVAVMAPALELHLRGPPPPQRRAPGQPRGGVRNPRSPPRLPPRPPPGPPPAPPAP